MGDPGSETESLTDSESLIPADLEGSRIEREKSIAGKEDEDDVDDDGSDQSSDILQPTQVCAF